MLWSSIVLNPTSGNDVFDDFFKSPVKLCIKTLYILRWPNWTNRLVKFSHLLADRPKCIRRYRRLYLPSCKVVLCHFGKD